jgi:hypothetical protein
VERLGNLDVELLAVVSQKLKNGRFHPGIPAVPSRVGVAV